MKRPFGVYLAAATLGYGNQAAAQAADSPKSPPIVVTARKEPELLSSVPLAITVLKNDDVDDWRIKSFEDLQTRIPGLSGYDFNAGISNFFIRGIGSVNRSPAADPGVAVFLNDVYSPRISGGAFNYFDLERVEVLRGPQGTLLGRNVVGGAISFITRRPEAARSLLAEAGVGSRGQLLTSGVANLPLSETTWLRLAARAERYGGNATNTISGNHLENFERALGRATLQWEPTADTKVTLIGDHWRSDGRGNWWHLGHEGPFSLGRANPEPRRGANPEEGFHSLHNTGLTFDFSTAVGGGELAGVSNVRWNEYEAEDNTTGLDVADLDAPDRFSRHHTLFIQGQGEQARQVSQELRWRRSISESAELMAGVYFFDENVSRSASTRYRFIFFNSEGEFSFESSTRNRSYAIFGHTTLQPLKFTELSIGARWLRDEKQIRVTTHGQHFVGFQEGGQFVPGWSAKNDGSWSSLTPSAALTFRPSQTFTAYAAISKGFKSGGFNDEGEARERVTTAFGPEKAWNYEIGLKAGIDGIAGAAISAYHMSYRDLQTEKFVSLGPMVPPIEVTANVGRASISGIEGEAWLSPFRRLRLDATYAYTASEQDDEVGPGSRRAELPYAPRHKSSLTASYTLFSLAQGELVVRGAYLYQSAFFTDLSNSPVGRIPDRHIFDANLSWSNSRTEIGLWAKNLTDELYTVTATQVPVDDRYDRLGPPRTFGFFVKHSI